MTNDLLFIIGQFPASYICTGIWFQFLLPAFLPKSLSYLRGYDVVRAVDYLDKDSFYYHITPYTFLTLLAYFYYVNGLSSKTVFPLMFAIMSWVNVLCMEMALQVSGKRKINFEKSAYGASTHALSVLQQSFREGAVCFGGPCIMSYIAVYEKTNTYLRLTNLILFTVELLAYVHMLSHVKKRQQRQYGSVNVTGRRSILDTIAYRFVEWYVIYYAYQNYAAALYQIQDFVILVTIYRSIQLGHFFGVGTYYGQTWIDAGPNNFKIKDHWFPTYVTGLMFRAFESTLSGYPKTIVLTVMLQKYLESNSETYQQYVPMNHDEF